MRLFPVTGNSLCHFTTGRPFPFGRSLGCKHLAAIGFFLKARIHAAGIDENKERAAVTELKLIRAAG